MRLNGIEAISEDLIAKCFPKLMKNSKAHSQEALRAPRKMSIEKYHT